jgi:hypothetical protein
MPSTVEKTTRTWLALMRFQKPLTFLNAAAPRGTFACG